MKLFSRMLSKKGEPETQVGKIELDMDVEPLRRRDEPMADDSGEVNATVSSDAKSADDPLCANSGQPVHDRDEEPEEVEGAGWGGNEFDEDEWDDDDGLRLTRGILVDGDERGDTTPLDELASDEMARSLGSSQG